MSGPQVKMRWFSGTLWLETGALEPREIYKESTPLSFFQNQSLFYLTFYFILEYSRWKILWWFQVDRKGTQPYVYMYPFSKDFPGSSAGKESAFNAGDPDSIPGLGWSPREWDRLPTPVFLGFPGVSDGKESASIAGDLGLIPGSGRSPAGGHGNPLQYSYLENLLGQRSRRAAVHGVTKSRAWLSD